MDAAVVTTNATVKGGHSWGASIFGALWYHSRKSDPPLCLRGLNPFVLLSFCSMKMRNKPLVLLSFCSMKMRNGVAG